MSLHPTEGARYLFELQETDEDSGAARYAVTVYTPDDEVRYAARLVSGGDAEVEAVAESIPASVEKNLVAIARTIARAAQKNLETDLQPWPRRVLRWRGPGRGK